MSDNSKKLLILGGGLLGASAVLLTILGNPPNMGFCIACFWRDTAGALGLHSAEIVQYIRPEVIGLLLGAFIISLVRGEFKPRGGSGTIVKFFMGIFMVIGALVFLGCPLRAILRLANGDLNALVGLAGFVFGIFVGTLFLKKGYTLGKQQEQGIESGMVMPIVSVGLIILLVAAPSFILFSAEGPGSMHAPIWISLVVGLVLGAILQRVRFCTGGAIRDVFLAKDLTLFIGFAATLIVALAGNLIFNFEAFNLGFADQPIAHTEHIWNFLGLGAVGLAAVLLGGCPLRQTILAGEGSMDSGAVVLGMIVGAAFSHNFGMAASPKGVPVNGKIGLIISIVCMLIIGFTVVARQSKKSEQS